eukprot:2853342-Rhodomonas_salina.2
MSVPIAVSSQHSWFTSPPSLCAPLSLIPSLSTPPCIPRRLLRHVLISRSMYSFHGMQHVFIARNAAVLGSDTLTLSPGGGRGSGGMHGAGAVSYTHLRAHETEADL